MDKKLGTEIDLDEISTKFDGQGHRSRSQGQNCDFPGFSNLTDLIQNPGLWHDTMITAWRRNVKWRHLMASVRQKKLKMHDAGDTSMLGARLHLLVRVGALCHSATLHLPFSTDLLFFLFLHPHPYWQPVYYPLSFHHPLSLVLVVSSPLSLPPSVVEIHYSLSIKYDWPQKRSMKYDFHKKLSMICQLSIKYDLTQKLSMRYDLSWKI